jgi:hypothetical protein
MGQPIFVALFNKAWQIDVVDFGEIIKISIIKKIPNLRKNGTAHARLFL